MQPLKVAGNRIRLKYFTCKEGGDHQGQVLNYVCVNKKCEKIGLLCSMCKINHENHTIIPLKHLLSSLQDHQEKPLESSEGFQNELTELEDEHKMLLYQLRVCVENLAQKFRQLQAHINDQFSKAKVELLERVQMNMKFNSFIEQAIHNKISDRQSFIQDISRISSMVEVEEVAANPNLPLIPINPIKFSVNLEKVVQTFKRLHQETKAKLTFIQQSVQKQDIMIFYDQIKQQVLTGKTKKDKEKEKKKNKKQQALLTNNYTFSSSYKSPTINLSENNTLAKQSKTGAGRFVFVGENLGKKNQKMCFRITHLKNWIGVGIGLRERLKSLSYRFQYNTLGHGSYLISSNGYSWSHSEQTSNITVVGFKYKEGDIVQIQYSGTELHYWNKSTNQKHVMKINLTASEQQQACFCANLCSEGDSIQIVNQ